MTQWLSANPPIQVTNVRRKKQTTKGGQQDRKMLVTPSWHPRQVVSYFSKILAVGGGKRVYILWYFSLLGIYLFLFFFSGKGLV